MESLIKIKLERGVIATTERQKRTVWALGLRYRESSRVLKDTPAVRGMVSSVGHLVSLEKVEGKDAIADPFQGTPEYDLGAVPEKKPEEKAKKRVAAPKPAEGTSAAAAPKAGAVPEKGKEKAHAGPKKSAKAPEKKSPKAELKTKKPGAPKKAAKKVK